MGTIRGKYVGGQIVFTAPADWPEGIEINLEPVTESEPLGIPEEEQGDDPESIARWLAWMDSLKPFLTTEDEAKWQQARAERRAFELASWEERSRKLEKLFE
ncbi:MAG: hypothetical protein K2P78_04245 [Gemmataceae bacterium]|nr:hypothetical protein [Gemmataceae bacterium]